MKSAAHCKAASFPSVAASDYIWLCELTICFHLGVLELHLFVLSVNVPLKDTRVKQLLNQHKEMKLKATTYT
jgi:hypothetical protein